MCTVTFVPVNGNDIALTSNRDESKARPTLPVADEQFDDAEVYFPKDLEAGGTWIAAGNNGRVCCLLNGGFKKHKRHLPYAKSRGQVLLDAFNYTNILNFFNEVNLKNIEPFTLVVIEKKEETRLFELVWDSETKHLKELDITRSYIWSSATLYNDETRAQRSKWFYKWLGKTPKVTPSKIFGFHNSSHGSDPENDVMMTRSKGLQTVSITQIILGEQKINMTYHDLQDKKLKVTKTTIDLLT